LVCRYSLFAFQPTYLLVTRPGSFVRASLMLKARTAKLGSLQSQLTFLITDPSDGGRRANTLYRRFIGKTCSKCVLYTSDAPYKGKISLQRARKVYFTGDFNLDTQQDGGATMKLDGKLNDDPAESKTMEHVTATLPCVDLSQ
jgi:hypothetical protein